MTTRKDREAIVALRDGESYTDTDGRTCGGDPMTPRAGDLDTGPDHAANTIGGVIVGAMFGAAGWVLGIWPMFLPIAWTFGAGWWVPVAACGVVGGIVGRSKRT